MTNQIPLKQAEMDNYCPMGGKIVKMGDLADKQVDQIVKSGMLWTKAVIAFAVAFLVLIRDPFASLNIIAAVILCLYGGFQIGQAENDRMVIHKIIRPTPFLIPVDAPNWEKMRKEEKAYLAQWS